MSAPSGYLHPGYAASLAAWGRPVGLEASGAWALERPVGDGDLVDAMGCYPRLFCRDWGRLGDDLVAFQGRWVTFAAVTDPFAPVDEALLGRSFSQVAPFKDHFVVDWSGDRAWTVDKHHRYYARRARRELRVEVLPDPRAMLDDWCALYDVLAERHAISGIRRFSRASFAEQLALPGVVAARAVADGVTVAAHLWMVHDDLAYSHLGASSEDGYRRMAAYAVYDASFEHLRGRVRAVDLGAAAGLSAGEDDGLARFKRGWANDARRAWFVGRVFRPDVERRLAIARGHADATYFPAYRAGEFK